MQLWKLFASHTPAVIETIIVHTMYTHQAISFKLVVFVFSFCFFHKLILSGPNLCCNSSFLHWDYNGICGGHSDQSNQAIMWYMGVWTTIVSITVLCFLLFPLFCKLILHEWTKFVSVLQQFVPSLRLQWYMWWSFRSKQLSDTWEFSTTIVSITIASCLLSRATCNVVGI